MTPLQTNRRDFVRLLGAGAAALATPRWVTAGEAPRRKPNIIFILADDMGYGDPTCNHPNSAIPTPNLDRLAAQGIRFTDAHTPSAVCTPTRYGLLTGRYCWRTQLKQGVLDGYSPSLIEPTRQTVASLLKSNGYDTAVVGKWHLGLDWAVSADADKRVDYSKPVRNGPNALGFDFSYVIPASLDMPPYVYVRGDRVVEAPTDVQPAQPFPAFIREGERAPGFRPVDCLDHLLAQAVGYIIGRSGEDKPFFLYFPLTTPHKPVLPHPRFRGQTKLGDYGDFVAQIDWTVGQVLAVLDETGQADNTLVFFTSDNGSFMYRLKEKDARDHVDDPSVQAYRSDRHRANSILRGTKADVWEGGHRVPFLARWPGTIAPGSRCDETICLTDLPATCAEIVGAWPAENAGEDSVSILPLLEGRKPSKPRPPVIHHSSGGMFAVRQGQWKLVLGNGSGGREKPTGKPFEKPYRLFDLSKDLAETKNLAAAHPEIVDRLTRQFEAIRDGGRSVGSAQ